MASATESRPFVREARIQWATASALVILAFGLDPDGDPVVLAHLRHLFTIDIPRTADVDVRDADRGEQVVALD